MGLINGYLLSENVRVFPCSYRGQFNNGSQTFDPEARLNTEHNLISPKRFGDKKSYVVEFNDVTHVLKCVIGGYYFELSDFELTDLITYNEQDEAIGTKKLYIKTRDVPISNNDSNNTTEVLASYENNTQVLDKQIESNWVFTGLKITDTNDGECLDLVEIVNDSVRIKNDARLPKISSGNGVNSIILNDENVADGDNSLAGGNTTSASGDNAVAFGNNTAASGDNAVAIGEGTKANKNNMLAVGSYNKSEDDDLFVVGNGTSDAEANRSNVLQVNKDKVIINKQTTINGKLTQVGEVVVNGDIDVVGDTTKVGNETIEGDVSITGNFEAKVDDSEISVNSITEDEETTTAVKLKADNVNIDGETKIIGDVNITGKVTASDKLTVSAGGADITGNTEIKRGTLKASGKATLNGGIEVVGEEDNKVFEVTEQGSCTVTGAFASGNATITGNVNASGNIEGNEVKADTVFKVGDSVTFEYDSTNHYLKIKVL